MGSEVAAFIVTSDWPVIILATKFSGLSYPTTLDTPKTPIQTGRGILFVLTSSDVIKDYIYCLLTCGYNYSKPVVNSVKLYMCN